MAAANRQSANQSRSASGGRSTGNRTAGRSAGNRTSGSRAPKERTSRIINDDDEKALQPARMREIYLFIYLAVAVFLLCSNFGICGAVGRVLGGFFFGLFGWVQYFLPFYLFFAAAFVLANGPKKSIIRKLIWIAVLLMVFSFIAQLSHGMDGVTAKSLYMDGYKEHEGGGFIFGGIFNLIYKMIGKVGAIILIVLLSVISLIMITGVSVINGFKKIFTFNYDNVYSYDGDDEDEDEDDEPRPIRSRKSGKHIIRNLDVLDTTADQKAGKKGGKPESVSQDEMMELIPDPYQNELDDLRAAARKKVAENGEELRETKKEKNTKKKPEKPEVVPVTPSRGLTIPSYESIRQAAAGEKDIDLFDDDEPSGNRTTSMDFFDLKPAKESYEDEVGGDWDDTSYAGASDSGNAYGSEPEESGSYVPQKPETGRRSATSAASTASTALTASTTSTASAAGSALSYAAAAERSAVPAEDKKVTHQDTLQATGEIANQLEKAEEKPKKKPYRFPPINLLNAGKRGGSRGDADVRETAMKLKKTMESFGVNVTITNYSRGPAVTRYEMTPEQGVKVSKILSLQDDIKLNLAAADIRIEAPIPGKAAIGIEVPNTETQMVTFRELIDNEMFRNAKSKISFAIGKDIGGQIIIGDIAKMPHMLIAGSTGSGKSVCINTIIMSILYKAKPEEVRLIMVDPKQVELTAYNGIPHMLIPVVTDAKKAAGALNWAVQEMERRYKLFARYNVRNLEGFNKKVEEEGAAGPEDLENADFRFMPQIVVIVDELADLMMVAHGEVEEAIVRLSQLARAAGIHLIIATQRPSVDVITGLIKANVPSRIAFAVSSGTDSRTILDMVGAEKLLGKGDMLYYPTGYPKPVRVQGAFVSDDEVVAVTDYIKKQCGDTEYDENVAQSIDSGISSGGSAAAASEEEGEKYDEYFEEAGRLVIEKDKASIGYLQRVFRIGFNRAARIMDQLADAGVVGPEEGTKPRKVIMTIDEFEEFMSL